MTTISYVLLMWLVWNPVQLGPHYQLLGLNIRTQRQTSQQPPARKRGTWHLSPNVINSVSCTLTTSLHYLPSYCNL